MVLFFDQTLMHLVLSDGIIWKACCSTPFSKIPIFCSVEVKQASNFCSIASKDLHTSDLKLQNSTSISPNS